MYRFLCIWLSLLLAALLSTTAQADDLSVQFPHVDCSSTFFSNCQPMIWEGAKTFTVTTADFPDLITCGSCSFTAVYYESFCPIPEPGDSGAVADYHFDFAGIMVNGESTCTNCDKMLIEELLTKEIIRANYQNPAFLDSVFGTHQPTTISLVRHTNAVCRNGETTCRTTCCAQRMTTTMNDSTGAFQDLLPQEIFTDAYPACDSGCTVICEDFPLQITITVEPPIIPAYSPTADIYLETTYPHISCTADVASGCPNGNSWNGPYQISICSDEPNLPTNLFPCIPTGGKCCFTLIYYEAFCPIQGHADNGPVNSFNLNIAGITIDGDSGCMNCDKDSLNNILTNELMRIKILDTAFMQRWWGGPVQPSALIAVPFLRHTKALCKNTQTGDTCGFTCCAQSMGIQSDSTAPYNYIGTFPFDYQENEYQQCSSECSKFCDDFPVNYTGALLCSNIPCNKGAWVNKVMNIQVNSGCTMQINYQFRKSNCLGIRNIDLKLNDVYYWGLNCPYQMVSDHGFTFVIAANSILEKAVRENIPNDSCYDYFRTINLSCWRWSQGLEGLSYFTTCDGSGCCWKRYRVCRSNDSTYTVELLASDTTVYACAQWEYVCDLVCDLDLSNTYHPPFPGYIGTPIEESSKSKNESQIIFESASNDDVLLEVYDIMGKLNYTSTFKKVAHLVKIPIKNEYLSNGIFLYRIWQNKKVQKTGKIYIIH